MIKIFSLLAVSSRSRIASALFAGSLLLLGVSTPLLAQATGTVLGTVTDASGAVIPDAEVVLTSSDRGESRTVRTDAKGAYQFTSLAVGTYNIAITAPSFRTLNAVGIAVDADNNVLYNGKLTLGDVNTEVTVGGLANTVETQSATLQVLIDPTLVKGLPLDGNNIVSVASLLPGVSNVNAPTTFVNDTGGPTYNVSGARSNQNLFLLDGTLWNNLYSNTGLNFPPPDALNEVSVLLNNFKAQYGRNAGSVFSVVTRSGTNRIHGVVYEYLQNTALNSDDYFLKMPSKLVQNQFGATTGGPILRDKLFYFGSYEGLRIAQTATDLSTIGFTQADRGVDANGNPTPCSAAGPFGNMGLNCFNVSDQAGPSNRTGTAFTPKTGIVHDPLYANNSTTSPAAATAVLNLNYMQATGMTLPAGVNSPCVNELTAAIPSLVSARDVATNELPTNCQSPIAMAIINKYIPFPNRTNPAVGYPLLTSSSAPFPSSYNRFLIRTDYNLNPRKVIDARYYQQVLNDSVARGLVAGYEQDAETGKVTFGDIGHTWVLRPNLLNVVRAAYKRYDYEYGPGDPTTIANFGSIFPNYNSKPVLPAFGAGLGGTNQAVSSTINEDIELVEQLQWTKGSHNLQFGMDYLRLQYQNVAESAPQFSFGTLYTGFNVSDEELGLVGSETFSNSLDRSGIQHDYYFYGQDDWRASSRLTINYGLRYELPLRYYQPKNQNTTFIPGYQSIVFPNAVPDLAFVGDPGIRRSLIKNEYVDLAPRFGFAYDIGGQGRFSIRGGYGFFYDAPSALTIGVGEPFHYTATYAYPSGGLVQPLLGQAPVPANYNGTNPQFSYPFSIFFPDPKFRASYSQAVNFGFQHSIGTGGVLEANYVLRLGRHQAIPLDQNPAIYDCTGAYYAINPLTYCPANTPDSPASLSARVRYPGFNYGGSGVVEYRSIGTSNYNGLQILYRQRASRGLSITSSFSYAKSIDECSQGTTTNCGIPQVDNLKSEYGPSDYDAKLTVGAGWVFAPIKLQLDHAWQRAILNGWTQSGIFTARTGLPFSVYNNGDSSYTDESGQRAMLVPGYTTGTLPSNRHRNCAGTPYVDQMGIPVGCKVTNWFNPNAWMNTNTGTFSNQSRNSLRGPAYILTTASIGRVFPIPGREGMRLAFRCEAINLFNTPNLALPNHNIPGFSGANSFTNVLATTGSNTVGAFGRRLQLSLKLNY